MPFSPSPATDRGDIWLSSDFERIRLRDAELSYAPAFFSSVESAHILQTLLRETPWRQDVLNFAGRTVPVPRLQAWYGDPHTAYGYSGLHLTPLPWTETLNAIRRRLETALKLNFNSVLLNLYRDGHDSVSWHSDDEKELGDDPIIASLSFGVPRRFELKQRDKQHRGIHKLELADGSLLLMGTGLQKNWQHQLPKDPAIIAPRVNLTFRLIR